MNLEFWNGSGAGVSPAAGILPAIALLDLFKHDPGSNSQGQVEELYKAIKDQLGLEVVPTNMPIEMLVVEKLKWFFERRSPSAERGCVAETSRSALPSPGALNDFTPIASPHGCG